MRVAIVGGGLIGCLLAWKLREQGADPVIIERGSIGREASWAGAGILCPINPWLYPDSFSHLVQASLELYPEIQEAISQGSGQSVEWIRSGLLMPFLQDDLPGGYAAALAWSERFGWQVDCLSADEACREETVLTGNVAAALLWPNVAQIRNPRLMKALHRLLKKGAVDIREQCEVVALSERRGEVAGLKLGDGSTIEADAVVLAAGSWSGLMASRLGFQLPVHPVKGQIVLLRSRPGLLGHIIKHEDAYFVPRADGHILVGASMEGAGFRAGNTVSVISALLQAVMSLAPGLGNAGIERQWMGFRPGSPDGLPFLGPVPSRPGLWVASGHYRNGVLLAPITAHVISRWILGKLPELDMSDFSVGREIHNSLTLGYPGALPKG